MESQFDWRSLPFHTDLIHGFILKSSKFVLLLTIHLTIRECSCKICKMAMGPAEPSGEWGVGGKIPRNVPPWLPPSLALSVTEASINAERERRLQPRQPPREGSREGEVRNFIPKSHFLEGERTDGGGERARVG